MPEPIRAVSVRRLNLPDEAEGAAPRKTAKKTTRKRSARKAAAASTPSDGQKAAENDGQSADTPKEN